MSICDRADSASQRQDHPLSAVPSEARQGPLSLSVVLFGFTFFSATMVAGGQLGHSMGLGRDLLLAVFMGNLLLASYASMLAAVAFRSGLSTVLMCRFCFGEWGSRLGDLLLGLTQIGWYAWGVDTVANILISSFQWPQALYVPLVLLTGLLFCLTAAIGYKGLEVLSTVMVPLMTLLLFWSAYLCLEQIPASTSNSSPDMDLPMATTIVVGTFVSGATQSTNWTRFAHSLPSAVGVTFLAFFLGNGLMVAYGALAGAVYSQPDVVKVLLLQGFFASALFMLLANIWTTQDNTIYNFSLAGCNFFRTERRRLVTVLGALVGTMLALLGFAQWLVPFLLLLGTAIPPLGGVILADFFVTRKGRYPEMTEVSLPKIQWAGLLSYAGGVVAASSLPGIAPVTGVVAAFLAHLVLARVSLGHSGSGRL